MAQAQREWFAARCRLGDVDGSIDDFVAPPKIAKWSSMGAISKQYVEEAFFSENTFQFPVMTNYHEGGVIRDITPFGPIIQRYAGLGRSYGGMQNFVHRFQRRQIQRVYFPENTRYGPNEGLKNNLERWTKSSGEVPRIKHAPTQALFENAGEVFTGVSFQVSYCPSYQHQTMAMTRFRDWNDEQIMTFNIFPVLPNPNGPTPTLPTGRIERWTDGVELRHLGGIPAPLPATAGHMAAWQDLYNRWWTKAKRIRAFQIRRKQRQFPGQPVRFTGFSYQDIQEIAAVLRFPGIGVMPRV